ncbi:hypothetical protein C8A01DRAFT_20573 [Parachaetomium inaequale]|uniref:Uncharacterized protein n=1 Tax=Parachaetomium inaequale TaxID=2588326 RepID=A0AAN6P8L0_9PEZI|nr:hypothetical protein C8A01DRAFT_20573 [Parachaetomium inaequale]
MWGVSTSRGLALTQQLQITSSKAGESLVGKFQGDAKFRQRQIPLNPAPTHPDHGVQLTLDAGRVWPKESYISLSLFAIPTQALREEQNGPWALSPESLDELDDIVAKVPSLHVWEKSVRKRQVRQSLPRPSHQHGDDKGDDAKDEEAVREEAVVEEEEEGWTTLIAKKKRGMSMGALAKQTRNAGDRRSI